MRPLSSKFIWDGSRLQASVWIKFSFTNRRTYSRWPLPWKRCCARDQGVAAQIGLCVCHASRWHFLEQYNTETPRRLKQGPHGLNETLSRLRLPTNLHHEHVRPSRVFWACISVLLKRADRFGIFLSAAAASALAARARVSVVADAARWTPVIEACSAALARAGIGGPQGGAAAAGMEAALALLCCSAPGRLIGGPHGFASGWRRGIGGPQGRSAIAQDTPSTGAVPQALRFRRRRRGRVDHPGGRMRPEAGRAGVETRFAQMS